MAATPAPRSLDEEDFFATPIFIQNFNQLSYLRLQIAWLLRAGYRNLIVIDNNSTYAPLLSYYDEMIDAGRIRVVRRPDNNGKHALWDENILERFGVDGPFVFTSSDIVPDSCCPADVVGHLAAVLRDNPQILKAGLGLRIDDLPAAYAHRDDVILWENRFWRAPVATGLFLAPIDATFALYRPGSDFVLEPAARTGWPYLARHEPWYSDSAHPTEEELYYTATIAPDRGNWARAQLKEPLRSACVLISSLPKVTRVHLGCGAARFPGWINVDADPKFGADITFDLETCADARMPLADESVDAFFIGSGFERIQEILAAMEELHRIAKREARFVIRLPRGGTHRYVPDSFREFAQPGRLQAGGDYRADWRVKRVRLVVDPGHLAAEGEAALLARVARDQSIARETIVELRAVKPARTRNSNPGKWPAAAVTGTVIDPDSVF